MVDFRAWIVAVAILLSAAGAYVYWLGRPRASYAARSLSAARQPSNVSTRLTKTMHVDGCVDDFIISPGEIVEPKVAPGSTLDLFRDVYGEEDQIEARVTDPQGRKARERRTEKSATQKPGSGSVTWTKNAFSLNAGPFGSDTHADSVRVSLHAGHVLETLDGIELGIDSMGAIFRKMQDRKIEVRERIENIHDDAGDGWKLTVSLYSACGRKFRSEYSRTIPKSPEIDRLIAPLPAASDGQVRLTSGLPRSSVFMNKLVSEYALVPSEGRDDSEKGTPSEHD